MYLKRKTITRAQSSAISYVILFSFVFLFTYLPHLNDGPRGIHQWAQADRVAVCLRYADGKELLDAATYSMKTHDGNTGVEFSGFQYLIGQIIRMGVSENYVFFLLRFGTFLVFFSSLFALVFSLLRKENIWIKSLLLIFIISSPLLLYYGHNFLPDILALSLVLWCYLLLDRNFQKHIIWILLLSGLAMLVKTSSGIYFISFMGLYIFKIGKKINVKWGAAILLFGAIACGIAYYDFNYVHLRSKELWSTVFLTEFVPVTNWGQFTDVIDTASRFRYEYFSRPQWWIILGLGLLSIWHKRKEVTTNINWRIAIVVLLGLLSLTILFGVQFMNHDYYVIATFMPVVIYFTLKALAYFVPYVQPRTALIISILIAITTFSEGNSKYFERMSEIVHIDGHPEPYNRKWILGAKQIVNNHVPKENLIFSLYNMEPNWSLVYAGRKGAVFNDEEMKRDESPMLYYFPILKPSHILCRTKFCADFATDQPAFFSHCNIVHQDDDITLYAYGY